MLHVNQTWTHHTNGKLDTHIGYYSIMQAYYIDLNKLLQLNYCHGSVPNSFVFGTVTAVLTVPTFNSYVCRHGSPSTR